MPQRPTSFYRFTCLNIDSHSTALLQQDLHHFTITIEPLEGPISFETVICLQRALYKYWTGQFVAKKIASTCVTLLDRPGNK